jgi:large subunit ribosomal protein LP0
MGDKEATAGAKRWVRKEKYKSKFEKLLDEYKNVLIVGVDNVGSLQMQKVRIALRGKAIMIMGKNTLMRMIIREKMVANPKLEQLLQFVRGNMGLIFTNDDLAKIRTVVTEYKVPAGAKSGTFAPTDVFVPPGPTGLDPGQTGFFQALNIATKIVKGSIEIVNQVHLIKKGDKITSSAVALLSKLDIKPFFYGIVALTVYENGATYPADVLDITADDLLAKFMNGVGQLRALSLAAKWPSELTLSFQIASGFRKLLALSLATKYTFKESEAFLKSAAEAPAASTAPAAGGGDAKKGGDDKKGGKGGDDKKGKGAEKKKEEEPKKEEEDDDGPMGLDLFG